MTTSPLSGRSAVSGSDNRARLCRVFEVEVIDGIRGNELPGQRRLATLTRSQERHHPAAAQGGPHQAYIGLAIDHGHDGTP